VFDDYGVKVVIGGEPYSLGLSGIFGMAIITI